MKKGRAMTDGIPPRILIVGAGVAGSLVASGLRGLDDVEMICLEKVDRGQPFG